MTLNYNLINLILNGLLLPAVWIVWKVLNTMRENELRHVAERTKIIADNHQIIVDALKSLTEKVDRHLEAHLEGRLGTH